MADEDQAHNSPTAHSTVERRRRPKAETPVDDELKRTAPGRPIALEARESEAEGEQSAAPVAATEEQPPSAPAEEQQQSEPQASQPQPPSPSASAAPAPAQPSFDTAASRGPGPTKASSFSVANPSSPSTANPPAANPPASNASASNSEAAPQLEAAPAPAEPQASFADLFDDAAVPRSRSLSVGDKVEGTVIHVGPDGAFVDAGGHQQAFYPRMELLDARGELKVKTGDVLRGHVVRMSPDGTPELGRRLGAGMGTEELEAAMREKLPVEGKVTGVNKGGVTVDLGGLRAFCPIGQLDRGYVEDASVFLQQTLRFEVIEIKGGKDVVLSRKAVVEREAEANREELLKQLKVGDRRVGTIVRVRDFGAFVELAPGIDGLIPTRELSHDRRRADQVVHAGQSVEVSVQEITEKGGDTRITLSLKALADDPWDQVERVASPGQVAQGVVRRLMDFGAFIELAPGIEGLLHVSELGGGDRHPSSFVSVGEPMLVTVKSVDRDRQRIALAPAPQGATAGQRVDGNKTQMGDIVKAVVQRHEPFGIFVQVEGIPGREGRGLIHERETGLDHGADSKKHFPIGSTIEAKVISVGKLGLSIKAIAEDEARREVETYKASQATKSMGTFGDLLAGLKK